MSQQKEGRFRGIKIHNNFKSLSIHDAERKSKISLFRFKCTVTGGAFEPISANDVFIFLLVLVF
ncbi:MAG: hypothetical protein A2464_13945 [Deltaproteobacteria bacterium RIFOXYC2_FULL_48_10]|nr:MAG: hypothetical protein A2464_13945 [Deltaproteobacteria bacterium RIFOXYC2_FULL_48_10]